MFAMRFLLFLFVLLQCEANQVVLITGASRGVGLATARRLADAGFSVYGTVRASSVVPPEQKGLRFVLSDIAVDTVFKEMGRIDILINNAGYGVVGPLESLTEQEVLDQMDSNFFMPIRFIQAVLPGMRAQKSGHIINISSVNAVISPPFGSLYGASKAALEAMSESLQVEVEPYNIRVSVVEPGLLSTGFSLLLGTRPIPNNSYEEVMQAIQDHITERMAHPELLVPSQTAESVADFLLQVILDPKPKLRYQTSAEAKAEVATKLKDIE